MEEITTEQLDGLLDSAIEAQAAGAVVPVATFNAVVIAFGKGVMTIALIAAVAYGFIAIGKWIGNKIIDICNWVWMKLKAWWYDEPSFYISTMFGGVAEFVRRQIEAQANLAILKQSEAASEGMKELQAMIEKSEIGARTPIETAITQAAAEVTSMDEVVDEAMKQGALAAKEQMVAMKAEADKLEQVRKNVELSQDPNKKQTVKKIKRLQDFASQTYAEFQRQLNPVKQYITVNEEPAEATATA